jgi:hypothetical protein
MADECRPPVGTPDGTVCVLRVNDGEAFIAASWCSRDDFGEWETYTWDRRGVIVRDYHMAARGWRFHSIAEPPADG